MTKNYRIISIVCSVLLCLLFVSCKEESTAIFPMDDSGYPKTTVVQINGETYTLPDRELAFTAEQSEVLETVVEVKADDKLEVLLAQGKAVCKWVNCNELEKEIEDMEEYYCLTVKIK